MSSAREILSERRRRQFQRGIEIYVDIYAPAATIAFSFPEVSHAYLELLNQIRNMPEMPPEVIDVTFSVLDQINIADAEALSAFAYSVALIYAARFFEPNPTGHVVGLTEVRSAAGYLWMRVRMALQGKPINS